MLNLFRLRRAFAYTPKVEEVRPINQLAHLADANVRFRTIANKGGAGECLLAPIDDEATQDMLWVVTATRTPLNGSLILWRLGRLTQQLLCALLRLVLLDELSLLLGIFRKDTFTIRTHELHRKHRIDRSIFYVEYGSFV